MSFKRLLIASSVPALLGAALLGAAGVQAAMAQTPAGDTPQCPVAVNAVDATNCMPGTVTTTNQGGQVFVLTPGGIVLLPGGSVVIPGTFGSLPTGVVLQTTIGTAGVNEDSFLNLTAQALGVSRLSLNTAFQQAEAVLALSPLSATQDALLNLVAQNLGVARVSLDAALQQAGVIEVNTLLQAGLITPAQAAAFDASIATDQFALGLGFGIPDFSAPAI